MPRIEAMDAPAVGPRAALRIETLVCPTRDRVGALRRCMRSYASALTALGRRVAIVVSDDSPRPHVREANAQVLRRIGLEYGVHVRYAGLEEKVRFARRLIARGSDPDLVKFALFDPERTGHTTGANRNALLLDTVGGAVFTVDDDTLCRIARAPGFDPEPEWIGPREHSSSHPYDIRVYRDRKHALSALSFDRIDPLDVHEAYLGRSVGGRGTIVATVTGLVGDCTWLTSALYLFLTGTSLEAVIDSDASYLTACASREHIHMVQRPFISAEMENGPTAFAGLDNRTGLCPFLPVGRGEDLLLWRVLAKASSRHCFAHLPYVMLHSPLQARHFGASDMTRGATASELHWILGSLIRPFEPPTAIGDGPGALAWLGEYLLSLGSIQTASFVGLVRERTSAAASEVADYLEEQIALRKTGPAAWRRHAAACAAILRRAIGAGTLSTPVDLLYERSTDEARQLTQRLVHRYGRLLLEWPQLVDCARGLSQEGLRLSRRLA